MCWPSLPENHEWRAADARQLKAVAFHLADIYTQAKALRYAPTGRSSHRRLSGDGTAEDLWAPGHR
eukprot:10609917-Alexandrium_andersonii.AAC.1